MATRNGNGTRTIWFRLSMTTCCPVYSAAGSESFRNWCLARTHWFSIRRIPGSFARPSPKPSHRDAEGLGKQIANMWTARCIHHQPHIGTVHLGHNLQGFFQCPHGAGWKAQELEGDLNVVSGA